MKWHVRFAASGALVISLWLAGIGEAGILSVTSAADDGVGSLRAAVADASAGDEIEIAAAASPILLSSGEIVISKNLTIRAAGEPVTIDAQDSSRILRIEGGIVELERLRFLNGHAPDGTAGQDVIGPERDGGDGGDGGAILVTEADLNIAGCEFSTNRAGNGGNAGNRVAGAPSGPSGGDGGSGGSIFQFGGSLSLRGCNFESSRSGDGGGGREGLGGPGRGGSVTNSGGTLVVENCRFSASQTGRFGGGISSIPGIPFDPTHPQPLPVQGGGAIQATGAAVEIRNSQFDGCSAHVGGTLSFDSCEVLLESSELSGSSTRNNGWSQSVGGSGGDGGAIKLVQGAMVMKDCRLIGNRASGGASGGGSGGSGGDGGAISASGATLEIEATWFEGNRAGSAGSGIEGSGSGGDGGAIYTTGPTLISRSTIADNQAGAGQSAGVGGGILTLGSLELSQVTIYGNRTGGLYIPSFDPSFASPGRGGAVCGTPSFPITVLESTIVGNFTVNPDPARIGRLASGGGIFTQGGLTIRNSVIWGNTSDQGPDLAAATVAEGVNLIGDPDGSGLVEGPNFIVGADPMLAPLGDYGGPTPTRPPLPGSPVIDGADGTDAPALDQRGFERVVGGGPDLGAVENGGHVETMRFWELDMDGDGLAYGVEVGAGSDPLVADRSAVPVNSIELNSGGEVVFEFRLDWSARDQVAWVVRRGDLPGGGEEIYRLFGPTGEETSAAGIVVERDSAETPAVITLKDTKSASGHAFYTLEVEFVPPPEG